MSLYFLYQNPIHLGRPVALVQLLNLTEAPVVWIQDENFFLNDGTWLMDAQGYQHWAVRRFSDATPEEMMTEYLIRSAEDIPDRVILFSEYDYLEEALRFAEMHNLQPACHEIRPVSGTIADWELHPVPGKDPGVQRFLVELDDVPVLETVHELVMDFPWPAGIFGMHDFGVPLKENIMFHGSASGFWQRTYAHLPFDRNNVPDLPLVWRGLVDNEVTHVILHVQLPVGEIWDCELEVARRVDRWCRTHLGDKSFLMTGKSTDKRNFRELSGRVGMSDFACAMTLLRQMAATGDDPDAIWWLSDAYACVNDPVHAEWIARQAGHSRNYEDLWEYFVVKKKWKKAGKR